MGYGKAAILASIEHADPIEHSTINDASLENMPASVAKQNDDDNSETVDAIPLEPAQVLNAFVVPMEVKVDENVETVEIVASQLDGKAAENAIAFATLGDETEIVVLPVVTTVLTKIVNDEDACISIDVSDVPTTSYAFAAKVRSVFTANEQNVPAKLVVAKIEILVREIELGVAEESINASYPTSYTFVSSATTA